MCRIRVTMMRLWLVTALVACGRVEGSTTTSDAANSSAEDGGTPDTGAGDSDARDSGAPAPGWAIVQIREAEAGTVIVSSFGSGHLIVVAVEVDGSSGSITGVADTSFC